MTIQEYFGDWSAVVDLQEADRIIRKLSTSSHNICPDVKDVFKAFRLCSYNNLKVLILGQDPYFDYRNHHPTATGIAFANSRDTSEDNYSSSLDVLRESVIDYSLPHGNINFDPSLEEWESQGVLLLNAALSCEAGKPGSHYLMWKPFISSLLVAFSKCNPGIVYVLMGSIAQSYLPCIDESLNHVICIKHPSWYARQGEKMPHDLWRRVNNILIGQSGKGINWYTEY